MNWPIVMAQALGACAAAINRMVYLFDRTQHNATMGPRTALDVDSPALREQLSEREIGKLKPTWNCWTVWVLSWSRLDATGRTDTCIFWQCAHQLWGARIFGRLCRASPDPPPYAAMKAPSCQSGNVLVGFIFKIKPI